MVKLYLFWLIAHLIETENEDVTNHNIIISNKIVLNVKQMTKG